MIKIKIKFHLNLASYSVVQGKVNILFKKFCYNMIVNASKAFIYTRSIVMYLRSYNLKYTPVSAYLIVECINQYTQL